MALWRRFGIAGFEYLIHYRKKRDLLAGYVAGMQGFKGLEEPCYQNNPISCYTHFRSFMASEQVNPKPKTDVKGGVLRTPKVEDDGGVRLNEAIREHEVRLVTDQGHRIVSIQEALFLARKHNLDLVEVQRKVKVEGGSQSPVFKPAVCKLMDYFKEKYKHDTKEKERTKNHATIALRNGENKEVRFKAKTELKDLKMKAETVKRLMERGYRVKCTAMHSGKDDEDLGVLLLNLLQLIEDICVIESGPHLDTKNPYIIVKHIKFTSKKGSKASKVMEIVQHALNTRPVAAPDSSNADKDDVIPTEQWETVESDPETEVEAPPKQLKTNPRVHDDNKPEIRFNPKHERPLFGGTVPIPAPHTPKLPEESNRYRQGSNGPSSGRRDGAFPGRSSTGNQWRMKEQTGSNEIRDRGQLNPMERPPRTFNAGFSPNHQHGVFNGPRSPVSNDRPGIVFNPIKYPPHVDDRANKPASPTPSYGNFSTPRFISSDDQTKPRDNKSSNASPPSPRLGKFTSSKKA